MFLRKQRRYIMALTIKERLFVNEYIETLNDRKAQRNAGFSTYDPNLLKKPEVARTISERLEQHFATLDITDEYILSRIKDVAESARRPVPRIKIDKDGNQIFYQTQDGLPIMDRDYSSELKALELLGRYKALFTDKQEVDLTTDFEKYIDEVSSESEW